MRQAFPRGAVETARLTTVTGRQAGGRGCRAGRSPAHVPARASPRPTSPCWKWPMPRSTTRPADVRSARLHCTRDPAQDQRRDEPAGERDPGCPTCLPFLRGPLLLPRGGAGVDIGPLRRVQPEARVAAEPSPPPEPGSLVGREILVPARLGPLVGRLADPLAQPQGRPVLVEPGRGAASGGSGPRAPPPPRQPVLAAACGGHDQPARPARR